MKFEGFSTENRHISRILSTSAETVINDIVKSKQDRMLACGASITESDILPVYFAALIGFPNDDNETAFNNSLYYMREKIIASPKLLIFIQNELKLPLPKEMSYFDAVTRGNPDEEINDFAQLININGDKLRSDEAKRVFAELAEPFKQLSDDELFSFGARMITWLNRCVMSKAYYDACTVEIPALIYYGSIGKNELLFLHFISRIGIDVLLICTNKNVLPLLNTENPESRMQIFELMQSKSIYPFPEKVEKMKHATVAYNAERELDTFLYGDTTIFRDFQFQKLQALTLKTTYEEIGILWHQPAKFRSGFGVSGKDTAVVPNIFAKISGVKNGDLEEYWDDVRLKLSPLSLIVNKAPSYDRYTPSQFNVFLPFYRGHDINIDKLKNSALNKYSFLSDSIQQLIFVKMQEAINSGLLKLDESELVPLVIYVGLNIDRAILRILQKFDFTKDVPKFIVTDVIEDTFSKVECIQLLLYNLLGFDIIIYTPTGYKNIETYLDNGAFETYNMNDFKYNVRVPKFKIPDSVPEPKSSGFFDKLFKKGHK